MNTVPFFPADPPAQDSAPLSFGQQRLWLIDRLEPDSPLYNIPHLIRLRGPLDVGALGRALAAIVERHEALRTTLAMAGDEPVQCISDTPDFELPLTDLANLEDGLRETELLRRVNAEARRPFALTRDLMLRARLFRVASHDHALLLVLHHIAADGWSMAVLHRELGELYAAFAAGRPSPLAELPIQYADFAVWQREHLRGAELDRLLGYWKERLRGAPALLELPADRPRPPAQTYRGAVCSLSFPAALGAALKEFSRSRHVTLFMTLMAGFKALLHRYTGREDLVVGSFVAGREQPETEALIGFFVNTLVLRTDASGDPSFLDFLGRVRESALGAYDHQDLPFERLVEELQPARNLSHGAICQVVFTLQNMPATPLRLPGLEVDSRPVFTRTAKFDLALWCDDEPEGLRFSAEYSTDLFDEATMLRLLGHLRVLLEGAMADPSASLSRLPLLPADEARLVLEEWNDTRAVYPADRCLHELVEDQARRTPDATALVFEDRELSYAGLMTRAEALAGHLRRLGVGPDSLVGICVDRSFDMMVGLLGILKAGGAYVPLDPAYPSDRIAFMLADSGAAVVLTQAKLRASLPATGATVLCLDEPMGGAPGTSAGPAPSPEHLAYVLYTSGSTGRPKGVMITHRNVVNFFAGMDRVLGHGPGVWLAVTSISFDISVLELWWTLARGFKVVLLSEEAKLAAASAAPGGTGAPARPLDFSLLYFADDSGGQGTSKYRLLLEGAKFADRRGFKAVWTPERHFHSFGGLYPNPAVTGAAIAAVTERVQIRAGSVVAPLHHPLRIAEEWSVVDNLSNGRVGISFASGWHDRDFTLAPSRYEARRGVMLEHLDAVRRLWRGEAVAFPGPKGEAALKIYPRPVQAELPVWLTASGNPETFRNAGKSGAGILTHLLDQTVEELAEKILVYREARRAAGLDAGCVTLMLHTFVGPDDAVVRETVRKPFCDYLLRSIDLLKGLATSLHPGVDHRTLGPAELEVLANSSFERYYGKNALFGTPERCLELLDRLSAIGVDEVACLIDFGVDTDTALAGLEHLDQVRRERARAAAPQAAGFSFSEQMARHGVTHLQCTPSFARLLVQSSGALAALKPLKKLLLGGEALPAPLAQQLAAVVEGEILNMYGPTETTVWSSTFPVAQQPSGAGTVPIGRPIANTQLYLVDRHLQPVPIGVAGELLIGGDGVARGYLNRPELTAEKFIPSPFRPGARLYRTGDLARHRPEGGIEFLGRIDQQVKLRGHRIELGEIEAVLARHPEVRESAAAVREDSPGDARLVAYVVPARPHAPVAADALREFLKQHLPGHMVPSAFVTLERLPLTPNGKTDRKALPAPAADAAGGETETDCAAPHSDIENTLAAIWKQRLGVARIGRHDNFFDLGGHSLLIVQVQAQLRSQLGVDLPVVKLFQYPTLATLATHLGGAGRPARPAVPRIHERARRQREALAARGTEKTEIHS